MDQKNIRSKTIEVRRIGKKMVAQEKLQLVIECIFIGRRGCKSSLRKHLYCNQFVCVSYVGSWEIESLDDRIGKRTRTTW